MKICSYFFCFLCFVSGAQSIEQCKQRFEAYLNFKGTLTRYVKFESDAIYILNSSGKKELAVYKDELASLAHFFEHATIKQQQVLARSKGTKKFSKRVQDSIVSSVVNKRESPKQEKEPSLKGYRVALDPGHFGATMADALVEQKYLYYVSDPANHKLDTIKLFESVLTFNTATILKKMLEEQGAEVMVTRSQPNFTSFNCTYQDWVKHHRRRSLDSLRNLNLISGEKYFKLLKCSDYKLFWDFFRDYDLANRANKINEFNPHVSVVIHYNVDEKNAPWKNHSTKNFSMAFIGGAFTPDNLNKPESKADFLRMLLTDQLNRSENLAKNTVQNFNKNLNIAIASQTDAEYLQNNCISTLSAGVFCRNLALCRKINSPLVYGESLYQDNAFEASELMRSDLDIYGIKANDRLMKVARSYYQAVLQFLRNN